MDKTFFVILLLLFFCGGATAGQSVIVEVEGSACLGDDKSRKETEQLAAKYVKRQAAEQAATYISSETRVKDAIVEKDLVDAYASAQVRILQEVEKGWYRDSSAGDCFRIRVKAEVVPDEKALAGIAKMLTEENPAAPLSVKVWTERREYRQGEKIKVYLQGNKPFYARIVYRDASGNLIQLLPNPYRKQGYFQGGAVYELPSGEDRYDLEVTPPFGRESVTVYASTSPVGELDVTPSGGIYAVRTRPGDVATGTRGVRIVAKEAGGGKGAAEFFEAAAAVHTGSSSMGGP